METNKVVLSLSVNDKTYELHSDASAVLSEVYDAVKAFEGFILQKIKDLGQQEDT